jgi:hypothetical protein
MITKNLKFLASKAASVTINEIKERHLCTLGGSFCGLFPFKYIYVRVEKAKREA